jgi:hypothetical protein
MSGKFAASVVGIVLPMLLASAPAVSEPKNYKSWEVRADLTSSDLDAIQAALPELRKREPSWKSYRMELVETDKSYVIEFWRPENQQTLSFQDRSDPSHPKVVASFERKPGALVIELAKNDLKLVDAFYER